MNIFVAIPGRGHQLDFHVTACLMEEYRVSLECGVKLVFDFYPSSGGIADGRNFLVGDFLKSECEKMVFLDSDITFNPGDLIKLALKPVDFVAGVYRHKQTEETYPVAFKTDYEMWADKHGLIEVDKVPFGFVCLSRNVFAKFDEKFPERKDKNFGLKTNVYFQLPIKDGILWGEDFMFCKEWNEMGGTIHVDPEIELTHWDFKPIPYKGHLGKWLKSRPENIALRIDKMKGLDNVITEEAGPRGGIWGDHEPQKIEDIHIPGDCIPQGI